MDTEGPGLIAGIEIHQQLDTPEKLFCRCPTILKRSDEHTGEFTRYLRATESELGEIDRAAEEEMKHERLFTYYTYPTTCLVEHDEEPPSPMNHDALNLCLTIGKMLQMTPVHQIHTMRKLVIDGSNTSGFQRTALVAVNGSLPSGVQIETICLEEEAAQRVSDDIFSLDRLGIPLVEITTAPCLRTPEEVQETAQYIGMVLRSTGRVKRGLGTIRQDINISIRGGSRVEIKGVQELDLIAEVVRREITRQQSLLAIREALRERHARPEHGFSDVTPLFRATSSKVLKKAPVILAVLLKGFGGLVGREIQPGRRLGSELSDYAKKCGIGGIFHTDELPAYGITAADVAALRSACGAGADDCVVLVAGPQDRVECAARQVVRRASLAREGVPEETRRLLDEGSTAYMRPLPGAARMYPETDIMPVDIDMAAYASLPLPPLLTERAARFTRDLGLDPGLARQIVYSDRLALFERAVSENIRPALAARTLLATLKEISRDGTDTDALTDDQIMDALLLVEKGTLAKEALPEILKEVASGVPLSDLLARRGPSIGEQDLDVIVARVVDERIGFVRERGQAALGPLMGVVMAEVRGACDGKVVSNALKKEINRRLS